MEPTAVMSNSETPSDAEPLTRLGVYEHYKGRLYHLIAVARHSETEEWMAVYQALYGDRGLWVRPLAMFLEPVTVDDRIVPRFRWLRSATQDEVEPSYI